jgi:Bacterial alpha-L-rhamnosidase 6 hairpin glycosidase domain/Bacterial alpha-L-rhamnosidase C-terminal domain
MKLNVLIWIALTCVAVVACNPSPQAQSGLPGKDEWRKYVLTPTQRELKPIAIISSDARGGALEIRDFISGTGSLVLRKTASESDPRVILDFGLEIGGFLSVDFMAASENTLFAFSETLSGMGDWGDSFGAMAQSSIEDRLKPRFERRFESPHWHQPRAAGVWHDPLIRGGFRYLMIRISPDAPVGSETSIRSIQLKYTPLPGVNLNDQDALYQGRFLSSDQQWNRIWYAGAYTLQVATIDPRQGAETGTEVIGVGERVIVDGAKRDRLIWNGDLAVAGRIAYATTFDLSAVRDSLRSIAAHQDASGYLTACSPVGRAIELCPELLEYHLWWLIALGEYYLYSGDANFTRELWTTVSRAMDYLSNRGQNSSIPPLLDLDRGGKQGHWLYGDTGVSTYLNALYGRTLGLIADLAEGIGMVSEAGIWRQRISTVQVAINQQLWNELKGAYKQSTFQPENFPQDGNVMMSLFGFAPLERSTRAMDFVKSELWTSYGSKTGSGSMPNVIGPFMNYWEVLERFSMQSDSEAWDLMGRTWVHMFSKTHMINGIEEPVFTTAWEHIRSDGSPFQWGYSGSDDGSVAHPWSAGATALLTNQVLGVRPTKPGFAEYVVEPHLGSLGWVRGTVPTPNGAIDVQWEYRDKEIILEITAPALCFGEIRIPIASKNVQVWKNEQVVWNSAIKEPEIVFSDDERFIVVKKLSPGTYRFRVKSE